LGVAAAGTVRAMSPVRVRPLGGAFGCLMMIVVSVVLSVLLTVLVNLGR
jgi:hypothetical protein